MNNESATINEILYNREDVRRTPEMVFQSFNQRPRYEVGDNVSFKFNGMSKMGRVTTILFVAGVCLYHIETASHQWFRKVEQDNIIAKLS